MSSPFLAKILDGAEAKFLRFEGSNEFVVEVNGKERIVSRDVWNSLPDKPPTERDRDPHHGTPRNK